MEQNIFCQGHLKWVLYVQTSDLFASFASRASFQINIQAIKAGLSARTGKNATLAINDHLQVSLQVDITFEQVSDFKVVSRCIRSIIYAPGPYL